jgi:hypothetical protein
MNGSIGEFEKGVIVGREFIFRAKDADVQQRIGIVDLENSDLDVDEMRLGKVEIRGGWVLRSRFR